MALAHSPRIITDGLVLCLDAANTKSYPGSGNLWYDMSGLGRNCTLVNGVGYNGSNLGFLSFDGGDDYVFCGTFFNYQTFTISLWLNCGTTQVTYADIFDNNHTAYQNFVFQQSADNLNNYGFGVSDASGSISSSGIITFTANTWYHVAFTFSPSSRVIAYVNGEFYSQGNLANGRTINYVNQSLALGRWQWGGTRHWNGKISDFMIYDTVLSAGQVQQNFNALRGRYGI